MCIVRHALVVHWKGKDVPQELRELRAGRQVVETLEDEAPALASEEEATPSALSKSFNTALGR